MVVKVRVVCITFDRNREYHERKFKKNHTDAKYEHTEQNDAFAAIKICWFGDAWPSFGAHTNHTHTHTHTRKNTNKRTLCARADHADKRENYLKLNLSRVRVLAKILPVCSSFDVHSSSKYSQIRCTLHSELGRTPYVRRIDSVNHFDSAVFVAAAKI